MAPKRALITVATSIGKGKRPVVGENDEVHKKATFDRGMFTTLELPERFNLHFTNRTVILGRNIDFEKLGYFQFDSFF